MGFLGKVKHCVGKELTGRIKPVPIALDAAGGDIAPGVRRRNTQQAGETVDDFPLDFVGVAPEIAGMKRVAHIVNGILHQGQQRRIVKILVDRIANLLAGDGVNVAQQAVAAGLDFRRRRVKGGSHRDICGSGGGAFVRRGAGGADWLAMQG